jgi:tRNA A-37 threonylcarbamoyl transferase component Bud32
MRDRLQKFSRGGWTIYAASELPRDLLIRLAECPELPLRMGPAETIKAGGSALVVRACLPLGNSMRAVAYKRVLRKNLLKQITQALGENRTFRAFLAGQRLLMLGVATARPLAVIVPSRFDLHSPSWLATEWLDGAEELARFAARLRHRSTGREAPSADAAAVAVGTLLGRMHAAGIAHRDLKPQNIMLRFEGRSHLAKAYLVDLDGIRFVRRIGERVRWRNLARLAIGENRWAELRLTTRYRFLVAYLAAAGTAGDVKSAWRRLAAATAARHAKRRAA